MNIWFDRMPDNEKLQQAEKDCVDDCVTDCDCVNDCVTDCECVNRSPMAFDLWPLRIKGEERSLNDLDPPVLHSDPELYVQQCSDENWLVSTPAGSGRIAVLDKEALTLLSFLKTPTTIEKLLKNTSHWTYKQIEQAIAIFYALGFVRCDEADKSPPRFSERTMLTAWLHVTNACNLRCDYCYLDKTSEHMTADIAKQAVDAVFRSAANHHMRKVRLKYAGGEASLHMRSVLTLHEYALQRAQDYNIDVEGVILSNGVVLSQSAIDSLKSHRIGIVISLDGLDTSHDLQRAFINGKGSSRYVLQTVERLLASAVIPQIAITVSGRSLDGLVSLMRYILEKDLPFTISYYRENACSTHLSDLRFEEQRMIAAMREVFLVIEQRLPARRLLGNLLDRTNLTSAHEYTCGVGQNYLVIDQHGGVAKCQADIKQTITTIAAADPLENIRRDSLGIQSRPVTQKLGCQTCQWRHWCTGGCPLLTYKATGRYDVQSPNCHIYQALFPEVLQLEALRLLRYTSPVSL